MEDYLAAASDVFMHVEIPSNIFLTTDDRDLIASIEGGNYDRYGFTYYYTRSVCAIFVATI